MMIVVPTRGRPHVVSEMIETFALTRTGIAELLFAVDQSDTSVADYVMALGGCPPWVHYMVGPSTNMAEALRAGVSRAIGTSEVVGFMGDDHRPRTFGWDAQMDAAARRGKICYGDDLIQGANLPTHVVMPAEIPRLLHGIVPQVFVHMYLDNYWKALGEGVGNLEYLPHVIVEHMHPIAGKAAWDDHYKRVNAGAIYAGDAAAFAHYRETGMMDNDIQIVRNWYGAQALRG